MARATARDWSRVLRLLALTLTSVRAAADADTRVLVIGHEPLVAEAESVAVDWPAPARSDFDGQMQDAGRKQRILQQRVLDAGGGLLMLLDADDWIERGFVAAARAAVGPERVGGVVERGTLVNLRARRVAALPDPRIFEGAFHRVCGSSGVFRLRPEATDPFERCPLGQLPVHSRWLDDARNRGVVLASIAAEAAYLVNTGENNSETIGPHADWKAGVVREVERLGRPLDAAEARRWGLSPADLEAANWADAA